ncbi:hypothetical protein GCM10017559_62530 [Streptosporangium longisporum]|uniref:Uncharacterized protein n=2 Tax=Streptosporangium longisporum TaxID=46187 RepID=A0ABP6L4R2_9ACTN
MPPLPVVLVDAAAVGRGHLLAVNGFTARALTAASAQKERRITWTIVDPVPADVEDLGELVVPITGAVECIRYADWLARRAGGVR